MSVLLSLLSQFHSESFPHNICNTKDKYIYDTNIFHFMNKLFLHQYHNRDDVLVLIMVY